MAGRQTGSAQALDWDLDEALTAEVAQVGSGSRRHVERVGFPTRHHARILGAPELLPIESLSLMVLDRVDHRRQRDPGVCGLLQRLRGHETGVPEAVRRATPGVGDPCQRWGWWYRILDILLSFRYVAWSAFGFAEAALTSLCARPWTDVVKSRIQMADAPPKGINYIMDAFRTIYREEGACVIPDPTE